VCIALLGGLWAAVPANAQTATPTNKFAIDQAAPDLATANSYTYRLYADGSPTGVVIPMVCTGTASPFLCTASVGAFTPGAHTVTLTAANLAGESGKSNVVTFTMVVVPQPPANARIQ
jgi:hypothetical protein